MISLRRGVNLSHWLSQSSRRGLERERWIGGADFALMAELGFDHVRLPLDEEHLWDESGRREGAAWELLDRALDLAAEHGLRAVCDLHILRSHHFNQADVPALYRDPAALDAFCGLWSELGSHLSRRDPESVALEILNEAVARDGADWNRVAARAFSAIREVAKGHTILTGSNWYCMCKTFGELEIPADPNQLLTFHFYNPMCITHYRASWTEIGAWTGPVEYPGLPWPFGVPTDVPEPLRSRMEQSNVVSDESTMLEEIQLPLSRARETGLGLYCGEFGVHDKAPLELRKAWLSDAVAVFESQGIGWAVWDWKGVFGVVDGEMRPTGIHEALIPQG
ncbi:MAG: cellulase family glycosylhydrolase [Fibrobacteria bacterium]|nr:cellulase family glycosylhydrolase [Fibrobacteria bacterium]